MSDAESGRRPQAHDRDDEAAMSTPPGDIAAGDEDGNEFENLRLRGGDSSAAMSMDEDGDNDNEDGDNDNEDGESGEDPTPPRRQAGRANGGAVRMPAGTDPSSALDFQPGAIVRVTVDDFVTYEHADFYPGPNLNMVIGPNGTGKSSLVCAICLGLGYHSNVLGRAGTFGEFVKRGKETAVVEVELMREAHQAANHVVRLRISREDNSRKFWIDGRESPLKNVQKLTRSLRIQIDNLCQFLPQDKVAEFAGLNSVELLTRTLQAAAPPEMTEWHEELKQMYEDQKKGRVELQASESRLTGLENQQNALAADVQKLRDREEILRNIEELKVARKLVIYNENRHKHREAKQQFKEAVRNHKRLQESTAPSLEAVNKKQEYEAKVNTVVEQRRRALRGAEQTADQTVVEIASLDDQLKSIEQKDEAERAAFTTKRQELGKIRQKITQLEAQQRRTPVQFDPAHFNTLIREEEHKLREIDSLMGEMEQEKSRLHELGGRKKQEMAETQKEIEALDSQQGQLLVQLKRVKPDIYKGWQWLQQHSDEFEKDVFGPPMITCSIKDERYSDQVQATLQASDFFTFTTQSVADHKKLSNAFYKDLRISADIKACTLPLASFRSPLPRGELAGLGLDGYALDYLEGPEPVLAMLCSEKRLHATGVALGEISDGQVQDLMSSERINAWADNTSYSRVTRRREYGPHAVSTMVRKLEKGRFWTTQQVDMGERTELRQKLAEVQDQFSELKENNKKIKEKQAELGEKVKEIQEKKDAIRNEKNELQAEYNRYEALPRKIETEKKNLEEKQAELSEQRARVNGLKDQQEKIAVERAQMVLRHKDEIEEIRTAHQGLLEAQIRLIEARSDVHGLKERNADIVRMLEVEAQRVTELEVEQQKHRKVAAALRKELEDMIEEDPPLQQRMLALAEGKSVEGIDGEISAEEVRLGMTRANNEDALAEFETRAAEIERLGRTRDKQQGLMRKLEQQIGERRGMWEPQLDELVEQINDAFSYNFAQISCAGEISVHKDEDFAQWAIDIKVKFRENEALQRLDQHRQSGGERAVSTIFYLMSLQSMAQAPFRVVDEINQGMDPRNERMVHERMVEIACREHTSQYFLITPKLLTGLRYDDRMRVLCIASGEFLDPGRLDFSRCVRIQRRKKERASGGHLAAQAA